MADPRDNRVGGDSDVLPEDLGRGGLNRLLNMRIPMPFSIRGRLPWRKRASWRQIVIAAGLPRELTLLVAEVIRRARLWPSEQADVSRELCAHFADGLHSGREARELCAAFGAARPAARLIARAARRKRPLWWKTWRLGLKGAACGVLACVGLYATLGVMVLVGKPTITRHFAAEINARLASVPEERRAWPRYEAIRKSLGAIPPELAQPKDAQGQNLDTSHLADYWPQQRTSELWPKAAAWVDGKQDAIGRLRETAIMPELGCPMYAVKDPANPPASPNSDSGSDIAGLVPADGSTSLVAVQLPFLADARYFARLLVVDARRAIELKNGARFAGDAEAMIGLCRHAREDGTLIGQLVGFAVLHLACDTIGEALSAGILNEEQMTRIAHRLGSGGDDAARVKFDMERTFLEDVLQRTHTDNGHGGGHITYEGLKELSAMTTMAQPMTPELEQQQKDEALRLKAFSPVAVLTVAGREETLALADRWYGRAQGQSDTPFWKRGEGSLDRELEALTNSVGGKTGRYAVLTTLLPAFDRAGLSGQQMHQERDGLLVALAIEVYRARHGTYPARLEDCVPVILPQVPPDRFDGSEIKYRLRGEGSDVHPVVYSIGADRMDDGGSRPSADWQEFEVKRDRTPAEVKIWLDNPASASRLRGDWVLYDPAGRAERLPDPSKAEPAVPAAPAQPSPTPKPSSGIPRSAQ